MVEELKHVLIPENIFNPVWKITDATLENEVGIFVVLFITLFLLCVAHIFLIRKSNGSNGWFFEKPRMTPETGVVSVRGRRVHMEDTYQSTLLQSSPHIDMKLHAVLDGHRGDRAANFGAEKLPRIVAEKLSGCDVSDVDVVRRGMFDSYRELDMEFLELAAEKHWQDGTTVVSLLTAENKDTKDVSVYVANTGDSRAILVTKSVDNKVVEMSSDHKPNKPSERERITSNNGRISFAGTWRVEGQLAVSRAIGDIHLKQWVIPDPDIMHRKLSEDDLCVVLATDGVWDVLSNATVADLCLKVHANHEPSSGKKWVQEAAELITRKAFLRGSTDNITTLVVDLRLQ